jgi:hypothetical protein
MPDEESNYRLLAFAQICNEIGAPESSRKGCPTRQLAITAARFKPAFADRASAGFALQVQHLHLGSGDLPLTPR